MQNASVLDKVQVDYYGAPTPVVQLANITVPEARLLVIQPYDKTSIGDIEKAILKADLGLNPSNDGTVIRIAFPALTEERRRDLVKSCEKNMLKKQKLLFVTYVVTVTMILRSLKKAGEITEDDLRGYTEDIQKETDKYIAKVDEIAKNKEKEIMEV